MVVTHVLMMYTCSFYGHHLHIHDGTHPVFFEDIQISAPRFETMALVSYPFSSIDTSVDVDTGCGQGLTVRPLRSCSNIKSDSVPSIQ